MQWKSPEWIQSFGLHTDNVLDYFSQSPFFDKTSNNQVVKMQQQFSQQGTPPSSMPINSSGTAPLERSAIWERYPVHAMLERELLKLKGIEYMLVLVREPDLWIIRKQMRHDASSTTTLRDYYVIGSAVYQSPTVYKIVQNRLLSTNYHLSNALTQLNKLLEFQPSQGASFIRSSDTSSSSASNPSVVPGSSVPETGPTNTGTTGATTVAAASLDPEHRQDTINDEIMDLSLIHI